MPLPYFCNVEGLVIILLSLCLAVGLVTLLMVFLLFARWKRSIRPGRFPESDSAATHSILQAAVKPVSVIEKKYLVLFLEGKSTEEISKAMRVEPSSVYTMKYRIKKKYPGDYQFPF